MILITLACEAISFNRLIYPMKIKDDTGYILEQPKAPNRIVSASPVITEILFEFQLQDKLVGITENCNFPEATKDIAHIGNDKIDNSKLLKAQPDLVLVRLSEKNADIEGLRKMKFTDTSSIEPREASVEVFAVDPVSLKDIIANISLIGTVTNREHSAYSLNQRLKRKIGWVEARCASSKGYRKYRAMVLVSKHPMMFAADGTYLNDMLKTCGFICVVPKGEGPAIKMSRKDIEKADPDIIITSKDVAGNPGDIYGNRDFRKTSVAKTKMVLCLDPEIFSRPGPRVVQALESIGAFAYGWEENGEIKE
jgi:iron complex transport system substrate-binding protein